MIVEIVAIIGLLLCTVGFFLYEIKKTFDIYRYIKFGFHIGIIIVMVFHWRNISIFKNDVLDSVGL